MVIRDIVIAILIANVLWEIIKYGIISLGLCHFLLLILFLFLAWAGIIILREAREYYVRSRI